AWCRRRGRCRTRDAGRRMPQAVLPRCPVLPGLVGEAVGALKPPWRPRPVQARPGWLAALHAQRWAAAGRPARAAAPLPVAAGPVVRLSLVFLQRAPFR